MRRALWLLAAAGCATARPAGVATTLSRVPVRSVNTGAEWVTLADLGRGRPMVIELFATWCEPCRAEIARVDELARRVNGDLLVVAVDTAEEPVTVERFLRRHGITALPVYLDPELRFQDSLGTTSVPQILVVDRQGRIVHRGATLDAAARGAIDVVVSEGARPRTE